MNDKFNYEALKLEKFQNNYYDYENAVSYANSLTRSGTQKEKLSILEDKLSSANPYKKYQSFNMLKNDNETINNNTNYSKEDKNAFDDNESIKNSILLMDLKSNHQSLLNKLDDLSKNIIGDKISNYDNSVYTENRFYSKPFEMKNYYNKDLIEDNFLITRNKQNQIEEENINKKNKESNYLSKKKDEINKMQNISSSNFYKHEIKNIIPNENFNFSSNNFKRSDNYDHFNKNMKNDGFDIKNNFEYSNIKEAEIFDKEKFLISNGFKSSNKDMKYGYSKYDLEKLDEKIESVKKNITKSIHRAETMQINNNKNRRNNNVVKNKIFNKFKTFDTERLKNLKSVFIGNNKNFLFGII